MTSPWSVAFWPAVKVAVAFGLAAMKARNSVPSARCTVGNQWLSVSNVGQGWVVEDHANRPALQDVETLLDPSYLASLTGDDFAGEQTLGSRLGAQRVAVRRRGGKNHRCWPRPIGDGCTGVGERSGRPRPR